MLFLWRVYESLAMYKMGASGALACIWLHQLCSAEVVVLWASVGVEVIRLRHLQIDE
jgi:hypothetical protein